jgi:hypothetical protein
MSTAAKHLLASGNNATWLGVALLAVVFLVTALPGTLPVDASHNGVMLVGP